MPVRDVPSSHDSVFLGVLPIHDKSAAQEPTLYLPRSKYGSSCLLLQVHVSSSLYLKTTILVAARRPSPRPLVAEDHAR